MKRTLFAAVAALLFMSVVPAMAQDMRSAYKQAQQEREAEEAKAREIEERILNDRDALLAEVQRLEGEMSALESRLSSTEHYIEVTEAKRADLEEQWESSELDFQEISGNVRMAARDLESILTQSQLTAFDPQRVDLASRLLDSGYFPDIDDISSMAGIILDEIRQSGQVAIRDAEIINRSGEKETVPVLVLGRFTAAYDAPGENGFLDYSTDGRRFVALSKLPGGGLGKDLDAYLAGQIDQVPVDMSLGNALRQIVYKTDLMEQIRAGGPLVYPIAVLAVVALLIILYKLVDLSMVGRGTEKFMSRIQDHVFNGEWNEVEGVLARERGHSPITKVIREGMKVRDEDRETQESVLQEAILAQLPRVERGLSILAVLGSVAPLLGLLGTVTGMIETFRVITLYGTGDPKLMSGGISEALVTTELGLAVAIPIMLMHTLLNRRSDRIVGKMEEKAVQLTNILQIQRKEPLKAMQAEG